jgi:hypothetical protein
MDDTYLHRLSRRIHRSDEAAPPPTRADGRATSWTDPERPLSDAPRARDRRHPVDACEVCGRTLLAGESTREIIRGERVFEACTLCVISATHHDAPRRVA